MDSVATSSPSESMTRSSDTTEAANKKATDINDISETRRIQNRRAQKTYREKKKQRIRALEAIVAAQENTSSTITSTVQTQQSFPVSSFQVLDFSQALPLEHSAALDWPPDQSISFSETSSSSLPCSQTILASTLQTGPLGFPLDHTLSLPAFQTPTPPSQTTSTPSHPIQAVPSQWPSSGHSSQITSVAIYRPSTEYTSIHPSLIRHYFVNLPLPQRQQLLMLASSQNYLFVDIILAGIYGINQNPSLLVPISHLPNLTAAALGDPYINTLRIGRLSYFAAIFANASVLGMDFSEYLSEDSISPLCADINFDPSNETMTAKKSWTHLPYDLRPTPAQLNHLHHPYLDVLPFPSFRERAIVAASSTPPLLDEDELCIDLMNDGLTVWGSIGQGGMDAGTPWEGRSWEAKGWFLRKWWWLVGGKEEEMCRGSGWWAAIRGEAMS